MAFLKQFKLFLYSTKYLRFNASTKFNKLFSSGAVPTSNGLIFSQCFIHVIINII